MVTYSKLRQLLIDRKLQWGDVHIGAGVSWGTIAKINKDEYITLVNIEKICLFLNVKIGDIVEIKL